MQNRTLLAVWEKLNTPERQLVIRWVISVHPTMQPGQVPFLKLAVIFDAIRRSSLISEFTEFTAPTRIKTKIVKAIEGMPHAGTGTAGH